MLELERERKTLKAMTLMKKSGSLKNFTKEPSILLKGNGTNNTISTLDWTKSQRDL
jgi:hypothetical protein